MATQEQKACPDSEVCWMEQGELSVHPQPRQRGVWQLLQRQPLAWAPALVCFCWQLPQVIWGVGFVLLRMTGPLVSGLAFGPYKSSWVGLWAFLWEEAMVLFERRWA